MIDSIVYVPSFTSLIHWAQMNHPELVDISGDSPVITGFTRNEMVVQGDEMLCYVRMEEDEFERWSGTPVVEFWASETVGPGAADSLYGSVFNTPEQKEIYDRVFPHAPYEADTGEVTYTLSVPEPMEVKYSMSMFGGASARTIQVEDTHTVYGLAGCEFSVETEGVTVEGPTTHLVTITPPERFGAIAGA